MSLQFIDIFFLFPLLILGIIVSREDYLIGRIKNKWLVVAVIYGALALFLFSLPLGWPYYLRLPPGYGIKVATNGAIALLTGFFLYKYNFMAPGDAKLFFVFSLLLPLKYYARAYLSIFPSFTLLVNIFLPFLLYVFLQAVWHAAGKGINYWRGAGGIGSHEFKWPAGKKIMAAVNMVVVMVALYIVMQKFRELMMSRFPSTNFDPTATYLVFFIIYRTLASYMRRKMIPAISYVVIISYVSWGWVYARAELAGTLKSAAFTMVVFLSLYASLRKLFDYYIKHSTIDRVGIDEIGPGMRLANVNFTNSKGRAIKGGLAADKVEVIKKWAREKNISHISIYRKIPFAAWMFLGAIITIIFRQPIIFVFYALIQN